MTRAAPSGSENRANIPELDGVRGLAILFVFLFHCMPASGFRYVDAVLQLRGSLWIGVDLFFVLSGFLISGVLLDHHASPNRYRAFYVRRTLRIFPLYYGVLILVYCVLQFNTVIADQLRMTAAGGWFFGYAFNVWLAIQGHWPTSELLNHFWTLCVEEQFYLLWPFAVFSLSVRFFLHLSILAIITAVVWKVVAFSWDVPGVSILVSMPARIDAFALGGIAAFGVRFGDAKRIAFHALWVGALAWFAVALIALPNRGLSFEYPTTVFPGTTLVAVGFACFVFLVCHPTAGLSGLSNVMRYRWLRVLGKYSYGIYVYHWLAQYCLVKLNLGGGVVVLHGCSLVLSR